MNVTIRPATAGDYAAIHTLNSKSFGYDYELEKTRERLAFILGKPSDRIFVAELGDDIVGYVHAADYECTYSDPLKNILAIAVDEEQRGHGVGRALLAAVEDWAKGTGSAGVRLVSGFNREGAHKFYVACGYRHRKDQKNFIRIF